MQRTNFLYFDIVPGLMQKSAGQRRTDAEDAHVDDAEDVHDDDTEDVDDDDTGAMSRGDNS